MSLMIRLSRIGRLHRPYFRIVAIDKRCHREGKANEILGFYDPLRADKNVEVAIDKVTAYVGQGAVVSHAVASILKLNGYAVPAKVRKPKTKRKTPKGDGKTWVAPSRRALAKHAKAVKEARKAETAAALAARKAAPAEAPAADATT